MSARFEHLLDEIRAAHETVPALAAFAPVPDDLSRVELVSRALPCARYMADQPVFREAAHPLARAFYAAGDDAHWRDTYANSGIDQDFMDRFGCYCVIGDGGAWRSDRFACFVVTMPPGLHYPWHHHPAEELYFVIAGEATFLRDGAAPERLGVGDTSFHASNQPHAMSTGESPVMAYVVWRNHLGIKPVFTPDEMLGPKLEKN